jgi:tRNA nucleotidyltransferase (CCA-adding enzyme)
MPIVTDPNLLRSRILDALGIEASRLVDRLAETARPAALFVAGGAVRDAMLGSTTADLDLVVEGDAIAVARAAAPGARIAMHRRFTTATITAVGARLDIAMARSETYARPGALPRVAPADIRTDLLRRDFSIHAMALPLREGPLVDPCGGVDDLRARRIRVLHDQSFRDDATRIFRAFRYSARLGFEVEAHTRGLIDQGLEYVATIGGERLRRELELTFAEPQRNTALASLDDGGALRAIHRALRWTSGLAMPSGTHVGTSVGDTYFALLAAGASSSEVEEIVSRIKLKRTQAAALRGIVALRDTVAPMLRRPAIKPSGVALLLDRYPPPAVAAFAAREHDSIAGQLALRYLAEWRRVKPALDGHDLRSLGVPEGPQMAQALQLLRAARLDGTARDAGDERLLVARFVQSIRDASVMNATIEFPTNGR